MPAPLFFLPRLQDRDCDLDASSSTTNSSPSTRLSSLPSLTSSPASSTRRLRQLPLVLAPSTPPPASPRRGPSALALVVSPPHTATPITTPAPLLVPAFTSLSLSPTLTKSPSLRARMASPPKASQMHQPSPRRPSTASSSQQNFVATQDHEPRPSSRSERLLRDTLKRDETTAKTPRKHSRSYSYTPQSPNAPRPPQYHPPHASQPHNPATLHSSQPTSQPLSTSEDETYHTISGSFLFRSAMVMNMPVQRAVSPSPSSTKHSNSAGGRRHSQQQPSLQTLQSHPSSSSHQPPPHSPSHLSSNSPNQHMPPNNIPLGPHGQVLKARLEHVLAHAPPEKTNVNRRNSSKSSSGQSSKSRSKRASRSRDRGGRSRDVSPTPDRLGLGLTLGLAGEDDLWRDDEEDEYSGSKGLDNGVSDSGNEVRDERGVRVNMRYGGKHSAASGGSPISPPSPAGPASSRRHHRPHPLPTPQTPQTPQKHSPSPPSSSNPNLPHTPQRTRSTPNATLGSPYSPHAYQTHHQQPLPNSQYHANSPYFAPRPDYGVNAPPNTPSRVPLPASPSARHTKDLTRTHSRSRSKTAPGKITVVAPNGSSSSSSTSRVHGREKGGASDLRDRDLGSEGTVRKGKLMTPPPTPPHEKRTALLPHHHFSESPVDSDPSMQHPPQTSRSDTSLSSSSSGSGSGRDAPSHPVTPLDPPADIVSKAKYSRAQNLTHMPHHQHFDPSMHLDESGLPAIRSFNVRRASAQCKQLQGYVSFGDVEGLGGPPSPSPHEDCFNVDGKGNGDNRKKFGWFGW